jgi:hypothetical protein
MMTVRECYQRIRANGMGVTRHNGEFRVFLPELHGDAQERSAYYTDDAEDAALTAGAMRRRARGH